MKVIDQAYKPLKQIMSLQAETKQVMVLQEDTVISKIISVWIDNRLDHQWLILK